MHTRVLILEHYLNDSSRVVNSLTTVDLPYGPYFHLCLELAVET